MGPLDKRPLLCPGPSKGYQLVRGDPEQCGPPSQESWGPWLDLLPKQHTGAPNSAPRGQSLGRSLPWPRLALLCTCLDQEGSPLEMVTEWTPGPPHLLRFSAPSHLHPTQPPRPAPTPDAQTPVLPPAPLKPRTELAPGGAEALALTEGWEHIQEGPGENTEAQLPSLPATPRAKVSICGASCDWVGR